MQLFGQAKQSGNSDEIETAGLLSMAGKGTILIKALAFLPSVLQSRLLQVLNQSEYSLVGSGKKLQFDARVISTSTLSLEGPVQTGGFRKDLFYRLNILPIMLPSLKDRPEDIPDLFREGLTKLDVKVKGFEPLLFDFLAEYNWLGNFGELENVCEAIKKSGGFARGVSLCRGVP